MNNRPFFTIDVASEIRSLCDAQLRGTWQMPAELVRCGIRFGARGVSVRRGVRGSSISWKRGPIGLTTFENLAVALDDAAESARRQHAIADLERSGAEALLWAGGLAGAHLKIDGVADGRHVEFERRTGRRPVVKVVPSASESDGIVVRWGCSRVDWRRADLWLRLACRFSDAEVRVDSRPVARGFKGGMFRIRLESPLPCTIGLTRRGEEPVLWLLREGIVAARAVLPGYPPFEAAMELGGVVAGAASSADLRRAVRPYVADVCERAVDMMIEVARSPHRISGNESQRLITLLLRSAERDLRADTIRSLPLLPTLSSAEGLLSVSRLEEMADRRGGRLFAVGTGDRKDGVLADAPSTVVASPDIRSLLTDLTSIRFQQPPRRRPGGLRRWTAGARAIAARAVARVRGTIGPRVVNEEELSAGEIRLLSVLRAALSPRTVDFGRGGDVRRTASGWVLPRTDPAVVAAVVCVGEDSAWLYPLMLALQLDPPSCGSPKKDWAASLGDRVVVR